MTFKTAAAAAIITAVALPATAQNRTHEPFSFTFSYSADEVATIEGAQRVYERLESEVRSHCTTSNGRVTANEISQREDCVARTISETMENVQNSDLAQAFDRAIRG
ncbi:MAG: UrcA family protein [Pseudomonadota bacterium]